MTTPTSGAVSISRRPRGPSAGSRRAAGPVAQLLGVVAEHGHVADLAAGPDVLAVQVDLHARVERHHVHVLVVDVRVGAAEQVGHHRVRRGHGGGAERQVEHGPQVLLELRGGGAVDGPVAGVVRAHGQLVDQQPVRGLEQLHGQQPGHLELVRDPQRHGLGLRDPALGQPGSRRDHLAADAVPLHGLDHRVGGALPVRGAGHQRGQLPLERHVLLGQQRQARAPAPRRPRPGCRRPRRPCRRNRRGSP